MQAVIVGQPVAAKEDCIDGVLNRLALWRKVRALGTVFEHTFGLDLLNSTTHLGNGFSDRLCHCARLIAHFVENFGELFPIRFFKQRMPVTFPNGIGQFRDRKGIELILVDFRVRASESKIPVENFELKTRGTSRDRFVKCLPSDSLQYRSRRLP